MGRSGEGTAAHVSLPLGVVVDGNVVAVVIVVRLLSPDVVYGVIHHNMAALQKGLEGADLQQQIQTNSAEAQIFMRPAGTKTRVAVLLQT